jgi:EpsI family protein
MLRRLLILSLVFIAGAVYLAFASKSEPVPIRLSLSKFPDQIGEWRSEGPNFMEQNILDILGVDDYTDRTYYGSSGGVVGLYIGYYRSQRQGDTMHSPLNCMPGAGWNAVERDFLNVPIPVHPDVHSNKLPRPKEIRINRMFIQKGLDKQLVLYWYHSHGRVIASEYWNKIYTVLDAIRTNRTDAAMIRVIAPIGGTGESSEIPAEMNAIEFVQLMFPLLERYLPE